jgi:chromosome segregation ATPase
MEDELKAISAELASSIRREMDLEDLVDRLQEQVNNPQLPGRRTSDYFSDSGYSSAKFSEYDQAKEDISQIQRRAEQEKAQIRLELVEKLQDERDRRRQLDQQILELSEKASQVDLAQADNQDAMSNRIRELETVCEDLRCKLSEERQVKDNFEDLLEALKGELNSASNERDNLRDEIVPQLRARVEGLEAQAAENSRMAYDTTKIQQELQSLKDENSQLKQLGTRKSQEIKTLQSETTELRQLGSRKSMEIRSLKNEFTDLKQSANRGSMGLSRSASVASRPSKNRPDRINTLTEMPALPSLPSLSRSNTTKQVGQAESREALAERLKDVESQRDALHSALKSLLERQDFQNRENEKRIRALEAERDRILTASPRQSGYEREVSILRDEINLLRRRAEEAVEQKWQVEKGLGGLKMDLDRAETEIAQLRSLLEENDILIPKAYARSSTGSGGSDSSASPVTSASLQQAYEDLQAAYTDALNRVKSLEATSSGDERTSLAMQRLEQALATALSERDMARHDANSYRERVDSLQSGEHAHIAAEKDLADELRESARRIEELAQQVRSQLATNSALRDRLAQTVSRGEADQRANKERITKMEARLRSLEEQLVAAQTASEERVARHEDDIFKLKEAHAAQLQRLRDNPGALRSPRLLDPNTPRTPSFFFAGQPRSPRLLSVSRPGTSGSASASPSRLSLRRTNSSPADTGDAGEIEVLRAKVRELEAALAIAEAEMQEVIGRMSAAQIEVLNLQEEREDAVRETRRVQKLLEAEQVRAFEERFRSITEIR